MNALKKEPPKIELRKNVPLAPMTTMEVGGEAEYFFRATSQNGLSDALKFAKSNKLPVFIMGGGSNIIISDDGFDGLVIKNEIKVFESKETGGKIRLTLGAGEIWTQVVDRCVASGWAGIEALSGIPGTAGAAPVQNIGAYGQSVDGTLTEVRAFDTQEQKIVSFNTQQCEFSYRDSFFKHNPGRYVITEIVLELTPRTKVSIPKYQDLQKYFGEKNSAPLPEIHQAVIATRSKKAMIISPDRTSLKSVGSFFVNPVIASEHFENIKNNVSTKEETWFGAWSWPLPDGRIKVSAARLIESAGFSRGFRTGDAGISPHHAMSLINHGNAKTADIVNLARDIQKAVLDKFGVLIESEAQFVGFREHPLIQRKG